MTYILIHVKGKVMNSSRIKEILEELQKVEPKISQVIIEVNDIRVDRSLAEHRAEVAP